MAYGIYFAKTIAVASEKDSRIQVKILPQMEEISDSFCPLYPHFFRDNILTGSIGEYVWVVASDDFSVGYILGPCNYNTYSCFSDGETTDSVLFENYSIPASLKEKISSTIFEIDSEKYSFQNLKVTYWSSSCLHFVERETGGTIIAYSNGNIMIMRPDKFYVKIGDSKIQLNSSGVSIAGTSIKLQSEDVELGYNPVGNVNVTVGENSENSKISEYVKA